MNLRILTVGVYRPYLSLLGRLGGKWDVVIRGSLHPDGPWRLARLLRPNMRMCSWGQVRPRLARGWYDLVVCHDLGALPDLVSLDTPVITILHTTIEVEEACGNRRDQLQHTVQQMLPETTFVFAASEVEDSWSCPGHTIAPGLDIDEYGPYTGDEPSVLIVRNLIRELPLVSGYSTIETTMAGLPLGLFGFNPGWPGSRQIVDRNQLLEAYCRHRVYLHVATPPYGPGYTVALLEAMASGMPVVATPHPHVPVVDGIDGLVDDDPRCLRMHLLALLEDQQRAIDMGRAARARVAARFPWTVFAARWHQVLYQVTGHGDLQDASLTADTFSAA